MMDPRRTPRASFRAIRLATADGANDFYSQQCAAYERTRKEIHNTIY